MSNFYCKFKIKKTGKVVNGTAVDDYFGTHKYGYVVIKPTPSGQCVFTESEVECVETAEPEMPKVENKAVYSIRPLCVKCNKKIKVGWCTGCHQRSNAKILEEEQARWTKAVSALLKAMNDNTYGDSLK